jgi:hypothetical protein
MQQNKKVFGKIFLAAAVLGALFLVAELIFQSFGQSLCQTEGCRVVSRQTRFGDSSILLIGLITFTALALFSFLAIYRNKIQFEPYIDLILVVSLAGEGFLAGYQAFRIHTVCVFCLITLGFFLVLGILRFLYGEKKVIAGFLSFVCVFALFYLILPAGSAVRFPDDELILFYSKDCKYCAEVMEEIRANKINAAHLLVGDYAGFLKNMGIEHVPTLFVNKRNQKLFLTGKEAIDQYLFCKREQVTKEFAPPAKIRSDKKPQSREKAGVSVPSELPVPDQIPSLLIQPSEEGMCKENEKCE